MAGEESALMMAHPAGVILEVYFWPDVRLVKLLDSLPSCSLDFAMEGL